MEKPKKVPILFINWWRKELSISEYFKLYAKISTWKGSATVDKLEKSHYSSIIGSKCKCNKLPQDYFVFINDIENTMEAIHPVLSSLNRDLSFCGTHLKNWFRKRYSY